MQRSVAGFFTKKRSPVDSRSIVAVQDEGNTEPEGRSILAEEDGGTSLWNGRAKSGLLALCTPFLIALLFLIDVSMDFKLAASHWSQGNPKWAAYTLGVVALSLIIVDVVSFIFYFSDRQDDNKTWWLKQDKLHVRPWFYLLHFVFCGRIVRCFQIFKTVRVIRQIEYNNRQEPQNIQRYRLHISQLYEMSILGVVEAFTEEAPQVALQFYISLQKDFDWNSPADIFVALNILKSLILFSYSLLNFAVNIRQSKEDAALLNWISWASVLYFLWRLFMIISRLQAFALFANVFKELVFVTVAVHLIVLCFLLCLQKDDYFSPRSVMDILFRSTFCFINIFCFFPLEGKRTRRWAIPYYMLIFLENSFFILMWYFYSEFSKTFKITMLIVSWATFSLGIISLLLYYGFFHPSVTANPRENTENCATTDNVASGTGYVVFESGV